MKNIAATTQIEQEYRGDHEAPDAESGAPLHDLCNKDCGIYPEDLYGPDGLRMYQDNSIDPRACMESLEVIRRVRGAPNAVVVVYRAIPQEPSLEDLIAEIEREMKAFLKRGKFDPLYPGQDGSEWYDRAFEKKAQWESELRENGPKKGTESAVLRKGDWVTLSRLYAVEHGESNLKNGFTIVSARVRAKELFSEGNSLNEFGYQGQSIEVKRNQTRKKISASKTIFSPA